MNQVVKKIKQLKRPIKGSSVTMFANENYNQGIDDCIKVIENGIIK